MNINKSPLSYNVIEAAKAHARKEYPNESCGIVFNGEYIPCQNIAGDPTVDFEISPKVYANYAKRGVIEAIIHSHPGGPLFPTEADMIGQISTNVPWGIIPLVVEDEVMRIGDPIMWGDMLEKAPLIGRTFVHGIHDCYAIIRDIYALGKEGLSAQGVTDEWPYDPITLPEFPRNDAWWEEDKDLYVDGFAQAGFRVIPQHEARVGDVFLMKIRSEKVIHGGVLVTDDVIVHHLPMRASRREPAGMWGRNAEMWLRHEAADA